MTDTTLWSQTYDSSKAEASTATSQSDPALNPSPSYPFAIAYDSFTLAAASVINRIDWTGGYAGGAEGSSTVTGFTIKFWADVAGAPGDYGSATPLLTVLIVGTANQGSASIVGAVDVRTYWATIPDFAAAAGTKYWISIVADRVYAPTWGWAPATGGDGDGAGYQNFFESPAATAVDYAYSLTGSVVARVEITGCACDDSNVPAPALSSQDIAYNAWLLSETDTRCVLIEADYRDTTSGDTGTEYLATAPFVSEPADTPSNKSYAAIVKSIPAFSQEMTDFLTGQTQANVGNIDLISDGSIDDWLLARDWVGRDVALYLGSIDWPRAQYRRIWSGVTSNFGLSGTNVFTFEVRDTQHLLNQPCIVATLASGPDAGKPSPMAYGVCLNVTPALIDATAHTYQVHDGPIQSVDAVYQDGVSVGFTSDAPNGRFSLSSAAVGTITADVHGALVGGYFLQSPGDLLKHFASVRGVVPSDLIDAPAMELFACCCPQSLNLYVPQVVSYPYALMDQVVQTVGGFYTISRDGALYAKQFVLNGRSKLTLDPAGIKEHGLTVDKVYPPVARMTFRYAKNWTPQQTVSSSVSETRRAQLVTGGPTRTLENPNAANYERLVDTGTRDSLFTNPDQADAELIRQMAIWGQTRVKFAVQCFNAPLRSNLGDVVTIQHPRYGLSAGMKGVVVKAAQKPNKHRIDLGVLM